MTNSGRIGKKPQAQRQETQKRHDEGGNLKTRHRGN